MKLQQAILAGDKFKRANSTVWLYLAEDGILMESVNNKPVRLQARDILAKDWDAIINKSNRVGAIPTNTVFESISNTFSSIKEKIWKS